MGTVFTLEDAMFWFLGHSSGLILCKKGNMEKVCSCYPEAKEFFDSAQ